MHGNGGFCRSAMTNKVNTRRTDELAFHCLSIFDKDERSLQLPACFHPANHVKRRLLQTGQLQFLCCSRISRQPSQSTAWRQGISITVRGSVRQMIPQKGLAANKWRGPCLPDDWLPFEFHLNAFQPWKMVHGKYVKRSSALTRSPSSLEELIYFRRHQAAYLFTCHPSPQQRFSE